jgi:hypothetical protein
MRVKNLIYSILIGTFFGYIGLKLQNKIEKRFREYDTADLRGGTNDRVGF